MYLYVLFTFLQGHILVGLKRWFKEFCCTPKHMTRVKPELEWKANLGVDDSQDEVSYKLHLNVLKAESQQVKPNQGIIIELMNLIFKPRRVEIESEPHHAEEILEKFATLRDYDHICYSVLSVQQGCFSTTFRALFFFQFFIRQRLQISFSFDF